MTDIWIDPAELDATVELLAQQAQRIQEAVVEVTGGVVDAPRSQVGWIDETLVALTEDALRVAIAYVDAAVDLAQRAAGIVTDQAADTTTGTAAGTDLVAAIVGGSVVGGTGPAFTTDLPAGGVDAGSAVSGAGGSGPGWSSTMSTADLPSVVSSATRLDAGFSMLEKLTQSIAHGPQDAVDDHRSTLLERSGLHVADGEREDEGGRRGSIARPDPHRPGYDEIG